MTFSLRIVLASIQNTESGAYMRYIGQGKVMYVMSNRREERRVRLSLFISEGIIQPQSRKGDVVARVSVASRYVVVLCVSSVLADDCSTQSLYAKASSQKAKVDQLEGRCSMHVCCCVVMGNLDVWAV